MLGADHRFAPGHDGHAKLSSVVICTYNRARSISRTLRSLGEQTASRETFEVVVADDGSTDNTRQLCRAAQRELPNLRYVSSGSNVGSSSARNLGIRHARGDQILFTDDDCIAHPDWIERMRASLQQHPVVVGAIEVPDSDYPTLCHNISQFHAFLPDRPSAPRTFIAGANMGFRRAALEEIGGFNEGQRVAFDTEVALRMRKRGLEPFFSSDAVVTHRPTPLTLAQAHRYAAQHAEVTGRLRRDYREQLGTPAVLRSPVALIFAAPIIAAYTTAGIFSRHPTLWPRIAAMPMVYTLKIAWCLGAARGLASTK